VFCLLVVVVASYRQLVHAYPTGGGDYEVAHKNLGPTAGLTVASALLVDYVLTVAVSVSAGVDNIISAIPSLNAHRVALALLFVAFLTAMNLRGVKESGRTFAVPTYLFVVGVFGMITWGLSVRRPATGRWRRARRGRCTRRWAHSPAWRCCSSCSARSRRGARR
jgi:amino acid transporter